LKSRFTQFRRRLPWLFLAAAMCLEVAGCGNGNSTMDSTPAGLAGESEKTQPSALKVFDLAGHPVDPFNAGNAKAIVLIFVGLECPISNRYAPEIRRLQSKFSPKGIQFWLVYPNADESARSIRQHTNDYQLRGGVLRDPHHALVEQARVTVTPEAAVFRSNICVHD